jgi:hypothetical protein
MGIFFRITIGMMHTVHYPISPWYQIRRTLRKPGKKIDYFFPASTGSVHLVRGIAMQEKSMKEQRQKPMTDKERQNKKHEYFSEIKKWGAR